MEWLSAHFFRLRVANADTATFGLYPKWHEYVGSVASFLRYLSLACIRNTLSTVSAAGGTVPGNEGLESAWTSCRELFAPWIQPLDNNGQILSPWTEGDAEVGAQMVEVWLEAVATMQEGFQGRLMVF